MCSKAAATLRHRHRHRHHHRHSHSHSHSVHIVWLLPRLARLNISHNHPRCCKSATRRWAAPRCIWLKLCAACCMVGRVGVGFVGGLGLSGFSALAGWLVLVWLMLGVGGSSRSAAWTTACAMSVQRSAAPAAMACSLAWAKLKVCGPSKTGQPQAQASIRFCPPNGAKLPPIKTMSAMP